MNFYHKYKFLDISKNLFQKILIQNCKKFPIKIVDVTNPTENESAIQITHFVDQLLTLNKELQSASLASHREQLQAKIDYCEERVNRLVYGLYGLTEEEIAIVEKAAG